MLQKLWTSRVCIVALAMLLASHAASAAEPLGVTPREGILVLKNGSVLQGEVARLGEEFIVSLRGGEVRLRATDVDCFARDLDDAYEVKRARIRAGRATEHAQLCEWCLRHQLTGCAVTELSTAAAIDPDHPHLALLERRIAALRRAPAKPDTAAADEKPAPASATPPPTPALEALPASALETFAATIHPLLQNNCTSSGCHAPKGKSDFQLIRLTGPRATSRRTTLQNLAAVLETVDRQNPAASPLLEFAAKAHGGAKQAPLSEAKSGQWRLLSAWVDLVSRQRSVTPASVELSATPLAQPATRQAAQQAGPDGAVTPVNYEEEAPEASATEDTAANSDEPALLDEEMTAEGTSLANEPPPAATSRKESGVPPPRGRARPADRPAGTARKPPQRGGTLPGYRPVDPFDPEVFNRRFHGEKTPGR